MFSTSRASRTCVPEWRWATPARCSTAISISSWKPRSRRACEDMKQGNDAAGPGGSGNGGGDGGDENKLIAERRAKLAALRAQGPAFPNDFRRDALAGELHASFGERSGEWLDANPTHVTVGGRLMFKRVMGKASFGKIADRTGQIQLYLQQEALGAAYEAFKGWDVGDLVGASGALFRTRTGELSVRVDAVRLLVKSLRPLPDKWHGLADTESRYRRRYVDLIVGEASRNVFRTRARLVRYLRDFLDALDFLEVETPMMQPIPGGASARPFRTHHNALDLDMYLRVAPELYLKRLLVGGLERVYEINRNFRNEGLSTQHNPEFTMLEAYQAYGDYTDMADLLEGLIRDVAQSVTGGLVVPWHDGDIDFGTFRRARLVDLVREAGAEPDADLAAECERLGVPFDPKWPWGKLLVEIYEKKVEHTLVQPTFVLDFPRDVSPLARTHRSDPRFTEHLELIIGGMEIAPAYSELNDPVEQLARFRAQAGSTVGPEDEAHRLDEEFLTALEYGMP